MRHLLSKARTFARQPPSRQGLVIEAAVSLVLARILIWRRGQRDAIAATAQSGDAGQMRASGHDNIAREVQWSIARVAPWLTRPRHACLAQAIAASRMLSRRGIHWTLTIGVGRQSAGLNAHAWLRCGNRIVTGRRGIRNVTPMATYTKL